MKTILYFLSVALACFPVCVLARDPFPRPAFFPSTPPTTKPIANYTAADVFGVTVTIPEQLPAGHPYAADKKYDARLKTGWPGAKNLESIDALVQIALDAPAITKIRGRGEAKAWRALNDAWCNISYILREVMDVPESSKADALVRIVATQSDPMKKARAAEFASSMFPEFLDPRLLAYQKAQLDSPEVISFLRMEESPSIQYTARATARRMILIELKNLGLSLDTSLFETSDESSGCAALKAWLTANWPQITTKCAEAKAKPDRKLPTVSVWSCDARW